MSGKRLAEFLTGRLLEERPGWLSLDLRGELSQAAALRLIQTLQYFNQSGRLPDQDLERKIQFHPLWSMKKDASKQYEVCPTCEHLCSHESCWDVCKKFMHVTTPLDAAHPMALERIFFRLNKEHERLCLVEEMNARYPFPQERPDNTYVCQACRRPFLGQDSWSSRNRLACSEWCEFDLLGHPRIPGRKWPGFVTTFPNFKGGQVFYLGETVLGHRGHLCECYLWKMQQGPGGHMYAYFGEGPGNYWCWIAGAYANRGDEQKIGATGIDIDESWRILANTKDSYLWVTT